MTESDFLAMGETSERIELFDGSLFVAGAGMSIDPAELLPPE